MNYIGKGEKSALKILEDFYPNHIIDVQVPMDCLINTRKLKEWMKKQTVDIVSFNSKAKPTVFRIQGWDHKGRKLQRDRLQREILEENKIKVVDIWHYDCPQLFKERTNYEAYWEVANVLKSEGVKP